MRNEILFLEWASFGTPFVVQAFEQNGYRVDKLPFPREKVNTRNDQAFTEQLVHKILQKPYACVFTFNYFPVVAIACKACKVPYVSWTYDSPFVQLYSKTLEFETSLAFVFDFNTVRELHELGCTNVQYLPMAVPADYYQKLQKKSYQKEPYQCDVAFVGSLYSEDFHNPFRKMEEVSGYYKGVIDGILQAQRRVYGYNFLKEILEERPDLVEQIFKQCPVSVAGDGLETVEWTYANYYLSRRVTALDRQELLKAMGQQFHTRLYTPEKSELPRVEVKGKVDYYTEAPYVYRNSKINLNITLRSIQSGIPLRAFDIMGNGGFLLSNYQEDYLEFFEPEVDLVLFGSQEEAVEKAAYYLRHESERRKIAENGLKKVMAEHTYLQRVRVMCDFVEEYWK